MSIEDDVKKAVARGDLHYLPMMDPSDPIERCIVVHSDIMSQFVGPWDGVKHEERVFELRADLEDFVKGERLSLSFTPRKHKDAYMGLLEPKDQGTWEIRARDPSPGIRVFGKFAKEDLFVAFGWRPRHVILEWSEKLPMALSPRGWRLEINRCTTLWEEILGGHEPITGDKLSDYIKENAVVV